MQLIKELAGSGGSSASPTFTVFLGTRLIREISKMPCVRIVLNLHPLEHGRGRNQCGEHGEEICLAKQLKAHTGKEGPEAA